MGTRFADRRGYLLVSGTYDRDWGIRAVDREWAVRPVGYGYDFENGQNEFEGAYLPTPRRLTSGQRRASEFPPLVMSDLSSSSPAASFRAKIRRATAFIETGRSCRSVPTCRPAPDRHRHHRQWQQRIFPAQSRRIQSTHRTVADPRPQALSGRGKAGLTNFRTRSRASLRSNIRASSRARRVSCIGNRVGFDLPDDRSRHGAHVRI